MKTTIKQINRQTSLQAIGLVVFANFLLALIYYKTLFVSQSSIKMAQLDSLSLTDGPQVCWQGAQQDFAESSPYVECATVAKDTPQLKLSFQIDSTLKKQASIQIVDEHKLVVKVKQWSKVPRDFWQVIEKLVKLLGFEDSNSAEYVLTHVNTVQVDLYGLNSEH